MRLLACTALSTLLLASTAIAQAPAAQTKTTTSTMATTKAAPKARTAASLQCSKDADAKNIHGKPRKAFMSSCKKAAAKS